MEKPPLTQLLADDSGSVPRAWAVWFTNLWVRTNDASGTTAQRPTKDLYEGKRYIDKTLGKPIWLSSVRPTVWKDYNGTTV